MCVVQLKHQQLYAVRASPSSLRDCRLDGGTLPPGPAPAHRTPKRKERSDIVDALEGLVEDGLAKAYLLPGDMGPDRFAGELPEMPSLCRRARAPSGVSWPATRTEL